MRATSDPSGRPEAAFSSLRHQGIIHPTSWQDEAEAILPIALTKGSPLNFSFVAHELCRRFACKRSVSNATGLQSTRVNNYRQ